MKNKCPSCGSGELTTTAVPDRVAAPLGPEVSVEIMIDRCSACEAELDLDPKNAERISSALEESAKASVDRLLAALEGSGRKNAYVERAMGLPQRTIARWKRGDCSATMLALLRVLATYPWVVEVADSGFDPSIADAEVFNAAMAVLKRIERAKTAVERPKPFLQIVSDYACVEPSSVQATSVTPTTPFRVLQ